MLVSLRKTSGTGRRSAATGLLSILGSVVWTHALAGLVRSMLGIPAKSLAPAAGLLTLAAVGTVVAGLVSRRPLPTALAAGTLGAAAIGLAHPAALLPALSLGPVGAVFALVGQRLARQLPSGIETEARAHPRLAIAWLLLALLAVVQVGRLSTFMTNPESDWFLSTREPFYAKHECLNAYIYGAELDQRGEPNVYDAAHYPGLDPEAEPVSAMAGMKPEDPFQYAPQFLVWPRIAIALTQDYHAIRLFWFAINFTLCASAVLLLSFWIGGRFGVISGLLSPAVLIAFPTLHNFQYGQFHFAAVALAVLAMLTFRAQRSALGGTLLAVATLSKLFPGILIVVLASQRRWRDLGWTAAAGAALTVAALAISGTAPFVAFAEYHLPRLADGSAFAFGEAWPQVAELVVAGNQGVQGIFGKIAAMGLPSVTAWSRLVGKLYLLTLFCAAAWIGLRGDETRPSRAVAWVALLGLGSLASTGAWADYVPLTCVWLLALLAPLSTGRPLVKVALGVCAVLQVFLLGTMPLGDWWEARWMIPLSLLSALAMLVTFATAVGMSIERSSSISTKYGVVSRSGLPSAP